MSLTTYIERMKFVDTLIRRKATGAPRLLAKKLNLSRSQTMDFIREMKELGFPINYSRRINSYYYTTEIKISFKLFEPDNVVNEEKKNHLPNSRLKKNIWRKELFQNFSSVRL